MRLGIQTPVIRPRLKRKRVCKKKPDQENCRAGFRPTINRDYGTKQIKNYNDGEKIVED